LSFLAPLGVIFDVFCEFGWPPLWKHFLQFFEKFSKNKKSEKHPKHCKNTVFREGRHVGKKRGKEEQ